MRFFILVLCPLDVKSRLIGEDLDDGKDWRQEAKGVTEVEMVEWHHWLDGLQEIERDREARCVAVLGVTNSQTWLSN